MTIRCAEWIERQAISRTFTDIVTKTSKKCNVSELGTPNMKKTKAIGALMTIGCLSGGLATAASSSDAVAGLLWVGFFVGLFIFIVARFCE